MAKVVTQNNIVEIVEANTTALKKISDYLSVVINACKTIQSIDIKTVKTSLNSIEDIIERIIQISIRLERVPPTANISGGTCLKVVNSINEVITRISEIKIGIGRLISISWSLFLMRRVVSKVIKLAEKISEMGSFGPSVILGMINLAIIRVIVNHIADIYVALSKIKLPWILFSFIILRKFKSTIKLLKKVADQLGMFGLTVNPILLLLCVANMKLIKLAILSVLDTVNSIVNMKGVGVKVWLFGFIYISRIKQFVKLINKVVRVLYRLNIGPIWPLMAFNLIALNIIFAQLVGITRSVSSLKVGLWTRLKLKMLVNTLKLLKRVVWQIMRIRFRGMGKTIIGFIALNILLGRLSWIFITVTLMAPIALLATIALLAISLAVLGIKLLMLVIRFTFRGRAMRKVKAGILRMAAIITSLALLFIMIALTAPLALIGALGMLVLIGGLFLLAMGMKILVKIVKMMIKPKVLLGLAALILIVGALVLVALGMLVIAMIAAKVAKNALNILILVGVIAGVVILVGGFAFLLGSIMLPLMVPIMIGLVAMLVIIGLLFIIALCLAGIVALELDPEQVKEKVRAVIDTALMVIASLFEQDKKESEESDKPWYESVLDFLGNGISMIIKALLAIVFLAVVMVCILLITFLAAQLRLLQALDLNPTKIKANVQIVIDTAQMVVSSIFDGEDRDAQESDKGWFATLLEYTGLDSVKMIIDAIMAIGFLALMVVCIGLIVFLAAQLRILQELELQPDKIQENVTAVINTCKTVVNSIFAPDDTTGKPADGIFGKLLRWAFPGLASIVDALMAVGFLAISMTAIGMVCQIAQKLTTIQKTPSLKGIDVKVKEIVEAARKVINSILGEDSSLADLISDANDAKKAEMRLQVLQTTITKMASFATGLTSIAKMDAEGIKTAQENIKLIVGLVDGLELESKVSVDKINTRLAQAFNVQSLIRFYASITPQQLNNSKQFLDNYIKFIDKVGSVDLEKLQTTERMFANMAAFSNSIQGNFDKLAESLNEKIMPLLEELKNLMDTVGNKIEKASAELSASVSAAGDSNLSTTDMEAQVKRENPNASADDIKKKAQERAAKQAQENQKNKKGIEELVAMFKEGIAQVKLKQ